MNTKEFKFEFEVYDDIAELPAADAGLLKTAREATGEAYAPYSRFNVAASARMKNGTVISATNQENASYPVGICAERALLSAISATQHDLLIDTIAISYHNLNKDADTGAIVQSDRPISPCGMCRQALKEHEERTKAPVRLILSGTSGKIFVLAKSTYLLPLGFSPDDLLK
jgi:cytidine deaminase